MMSWMLFTRQHVIAQQSCGHSNHSGLILNTVVCPSWHEQGNIQVHCGVYSSLQRVVKLLLAGWPSGWGPVLPNVANFQLSLEFVTNTTVSIKCCRWSRARCCRLHRKYSLCWYGVSLTYWGVFVHCSAIHFEWHTKAPNSAPALQCTSSLRRAAKNWAIPIFPFIAACSFGMGRH